MFLEHFRWLVFAYSTVASNAISVFHNSFECFQTFRRLYVRQERIPNFWSKRPYALITKDNSIDFRNIKIKSVLTSNHSIALLYVIAGEGGGRVKLQIFGKNPPSSFNYYKLYFCKCQYKDSLIHLLSLSLYLILLKVYRTVIHSRYMGNEVLFFAEILSYLKILH